MYGGAENAGLEINVIQTQRESKNTYNFIIEFHY